MADAGIKKVTVLKSSLPPVNSENGYRIRFRLISEDKNRVSHWSPIKTLTAPDIIQVEGTISVADQVMAIVWEDSAGYPGYDVFVGFDGATPTYHGTTSIHSYSLLSTGTTSADVVVQVEGSSKTLSSVLEVYSETILL